MTYLRALYSAKNIIILLILTFKSVSGSGEASNSSDWKWNGEPFDFIVVGAGTAGCAIAGRLAESGEHTVLLIEEGGYPHPELEIPLLSLKYRTDPRYVKIISSIPQKNAALASNGVINFRHGSTLGGTSAINLMDINRGSPHDYNNWANLTEDSSWNYSNMIKYFTKYENYLGLYPSHLRGTGGPLTITTPKYLPGVKEWLRAGQELGYPTAPPNGVQTISFAVLEYIKRFGRRISSFDGYIRPLMKSPLPQDSNQKEKMIKLVVLLNSEVTKILFDENKKAVGVEIVTNSEKYDIRATREIIVSAGVIGSPILLQKSGIGPKVLLEKENITLVKELPVGENLQDNVQVVQTIIFNNRSADIVLDLERDMTEENFRLFNETGDGPYSNYLGDGGQAFLMSSNLNAEERSLKWGNLQLVSGHMSSPAITGNGTFNLDPNDLKNGEIRVSWGVVLTRPKSRGTVSFKTTLNGTTLPQVDFQFLTNPDDLEALVETMKFTVKLCEETKAFQSLGCRLPRTPLNYCKHLPYRSDEYWRCFVQQLSGTGFHAAGSARMGSGKWDPNAVVDSKLRVIGVRGLRVADASIMPTVINASIQGAVYAIAEKAAELILKAAKDATEFQRYHHVIPGWNYQN